MLCQNCGKNEATTHIKQVINGETAESHLCSDCAVHLGYGDMFTGAGFSFSDLLGSFFGDSVQQKNIGGTAIRCKKCGNSFEDIVRDGRVGCADCYKTFYDKLLPSLKRIHGKVEHSGKFSANVQTETPPENRLEKLKEQMNEAVLTQNFELAAKLRDEINELGKQ